MNRIVFIGTLFLLFPAASPAAEEDEDLVDEFEFLEEELAVDEVESASKHRESIFWSPSATNVYTREDLLSSGAQDLGAFLRRVPGFDVYRLKAAYPLVGARSLTDESNNLVMLLIDGREATLEFGGMTLWSSLSIDMSEIERIEVIRGPGSALYGANAYSAVVSVTTVTDRPEIGGDLTLLGGEYGFHRTFGRVRGHSTLGEGLLTYSLGLGSRADLSPSDPAQTSLRIFRTHGFLRYRLGKSLDASLHAGYFQGAGYFYAHMGDMTVDKSICPWVKGQLELALADEARLKVQAYYSFFDSSVQYRGQARAYGIWVADISQMFWDSQTADVQVQLDWQMADSLLLIAGTSLRYTHVGWEAFLIEDPDEIRMAAFGQLRWSPLETLQLTGGVRFDYNTFSKSAVSPRAVVVYRPWHHQAFRIGYGWAFRKPSFVESRMHAEITEFNVATPEVVELFATQLGNDKLDNEQVQSLEAGWRGHFLNDRLRCSVDLFLSFYRDSILFDIDVPLRLGLPDLNAAEVMYQNGLNADALGGEAEIFYQATQTLSLWANLGLRHVTDSDTDERLMSEPFLRANLGAGYRPESGLRLDLSLHYVSSYQARAVDPANPMNNPEYQDLGDNWVLMGQLGYRLVLDDRRLVEMGLSVRTPLGAAFREYAGSPAPTVVRFDTQADAGGERLVRLTWFYLRGSF